MKDKRKLWEKIGQSGLITYFLIPKIKILFSVLLPDLYIRLWIFCHNNGISWVLY